VTASRGDFTITPAMTLTGKFSYSYSKNLTTSATDARFMETGLGLAYRALADDRLNLLAKHTYLFDIPSPSQATERPAQRSHVFSGEALYLLTPRFEAGGHYAHRLGEVRTSRESGDWVESHANLAAVRGRYHLVKQWDAMAEYRWLWVTEAEDMKQGALVGVYRHLGDHLKLGVGYNFTDFSDDLTDLGYDSKGWFVTAVGKY
jgi:predicted porin